MTRVLYRASSYVEWGADAVYAARLAKALGAELTGLYVVPVTVLPSSAYDGGLAVSSYMAMVDAERKDAQSAGSRFSAFASSLGVEKAHWAVAHGSPIAEIAYAALWHDFIVSELENEGSTSPVGAASLVLHTRRPVIFVPRSYQTDMAHIGTVAFGWNGGSEAIRALYEARAIVAAAQQLVVLSGEKRATGLNHPDFDPDAWARDLGVPVRTVPIPRQADVGRALLHEAAEVGADLLIVGAYGRNRLSEWLLGGVSDFMVRASSLPVLLAH